jgi:S-DNA-T family DNA segregation ATPase FtsK/SpoIIIE
VIAVVCVALGFVILSGSIFGHVGSMGELLVGWLAGLIGVGKFFVGAALVGAGVMVAAARSSEFRPIALTGWTVLVLSGITLAHLAPPLAADQFDAPGSGGGLLGAYLGEGLRTALGEAGSYILLSALVVISALAITGISLRQVASAVRAVAAVAIAPVTAALEGASHRARHRRLARQAKENRRAPEPKKPLSTKPPASAEEVVLVRGPNRARDEAATPQRVVVNQQVDAEVETNGQLVLDSRVAKKARSPRPYILPPLSLLSKPVRAHPKRLEKETEENIAILEETLESFRITAKVVEIARGPTVTRYEIQLAPGIKVNKIVDLADNIAMSLAAIDVRVEAPIPGKSAIGIEVPNRDRSIVSLAEVLETTEFAHHPSKLAFALGRDVAGQARYADLSAMPHLLVCGATNAGKSVCLSSLIASFLFRATPDEVKLLLIDPKRVELSLFDGIPHLLTPVVRQVKQAAGALRWAVQEMERRYDLFTKAACRNIGAYNEKAADGEIEDEQLPFLVVVIDELADLMMQAAAEVETSITRLAQLARATGIHLVIATQRPSVDVITGTIKANISSRIAFAVSSQVDSRTVIDANGAERLLGCGDMLFLPIDAAKPTRIQGAHISDKEVSALVAYLKQQAEAEYDENVIAVQAADFEGDPSDDEYFEQAVRLVVTTGRASTSMLQRKFKIGYNRAARLVDLMEEKGIVGGLDGSKPRDVLATVEEIEEMFCEP